MFTEKQIKALEEIGMKPTHIKGQYVNEDMTVYAYDLSEMAKEKEDSDLGVSLILKSSISTEELVNKIFFVYLQLVGIKNIIKGE